MQSLDATADYRRDDKVQHSPILSAIYGSLGKKSVILLPAAGFNFLLSGFEIVESPALQERLSSRQGLATTTISWHELPLLPLPFFKPTGSQKIRIHPPPPPPP